MTILDAIKTVLSLLYHLTEIGANPENIFSKLADILEKLGTLGPSVLARFSERFPILRAILRCEDSALLKQVSGLFTLFIDCDAEPVFPLSYKLERHIKGGRVRPELLDGDLYLNGRKVVFCLHERQYETNGANCPSGLHGHYLQQELDESNLCLLNRNVGEFLLEYPQYTPSKLRDHCMDALFWGTFLRSTNQTSYVTGVRWNGERLERCSHFLNGWFGSEYLTATLEQEMPKGFAVI